MEDGNLKGLKFVSLILDLEDTFNCQVDLISKYSSNKEFFKKNK